MIYALGRGVEYYDRAGDSRDRATGGAATTVSFLVDRARHREQRAVPDADAARRRPTSTAAAESARRIRHDADHEDGTAAPHVPAGPWRHAGAAAARRDGAGADGARADAGARRSAASGSSTSRTARSWKSGRRRPSASTFELTPTLAPLAPFRDQHGRRERPRAGDGVRHRRRQRRSLARRRRVAERRAPEAHRGRGSSRAASRPIRLPRSAIGADTQLPSLELGLDLLENVGMCENGYSCVYLNAVAWKTPTTPLAPEAESARGLRAAVRQRRNARTNARSACARIAAFSIR